jgi:hypothetical protein
MRFTGIWEVKRQSTSGYGTGCGAAGNVGWVASAAGLAAEQERVRQALERIGESAWTRAPDDGMRARLAGLGHFPGFPGETAWPASDVAGHLRDSALIFSARIHAIRTTERPYLVDFATCDPARVARYRAISRTQLLDELAAAQQALISAVADVPEDELARTGRHEFDGEVSLTGILAFLPRHQADHADQLELLAGAGKADGAGPVEPRTTSSGSKSSSSG